MSAGTGPAAEGLRVGAVAIGRNEGARLERCLRSLRPQAGRMVYVDSGSTDGSVAMAEGLGVAVVRLDPSTPFTAARARNEGARALLAGGALDAVQFVDGDCAVEPGWIAVAAAALDADPTLGIVTGWRTEVAPARNVYHALCEVEWHRPAGDIASCGGDMMVRASAYRDAGGFDPTIIAAEDEEFCLRLARRTGLRVRRLPRIMTRHDADMDRLGAWWRRHVRTGHGFADVARREPPHFRREVARAWVFGLALPGAAVLGALAAPWWPPSLTLPALALAANGASWARTAGALRDGGLARAGIVPLGAPGAGAWRQAALLTLSKVPNVQGMLTFHLRRLRGASMRIIEYK